MPERGDAKLFQVLSRQARQNPSRNLILAERRLVPSKAKAPQPDHDVHDGARALPCSISSCERTGEVLGGIGFGEFARGQMLGASRERGCAIPFTASHISAASSQACAICRNVWRSLAERAVFAQPKCGCGEMDDGCEGSSAYSRNSFAVMRGLPLLEHIVQRVAPQCDLTFSSDNQPPPTGLPGRPFSRPALNSGSSKDLASDLQENFLESLRALGLFGPPSGAQ